MNCKNCNELVKDNFCAHCGQSTKVGKLKLSTFLSEFSTGVFQLNKGFFYTVKELFIRPGISIREYLAGKRVKYFKPIAYVFTLSTLYYLLSQSMDNKTFLDDALNGFANGASGEMVEAISVASWFASHYAYTVLLLLPVFSLGSYLAFIRSGYSYLEHFVLNAYITGQQAIFYSLAAPLALFAGGNDIGASLGLFSSVTYALYVFWNFFTAKNKARVVLLTFLTYLLSLLIFAFSIFFTGYFAGRLFM